MLISRWALTNKVDPFVAPIPRPWAEDPEVEPFARYLNRFLHDIWIRTGGGTDIINGTPDISANPLLANLVNKSTSGDALTFDTTGFTWDSSVIFFDETEA
jgi:hypothetical protein